MKNNKYWYRNIMIGWVICIWIIAGMLVAFMALSQEKPKAKTEAPVEQKKEITKKDMQNAYQMLIYQNSKLDSIIVV